MITNFLQLSSVDFLGFPHFQKPLQPVNKLSSVHIIFFLYIFLLLISAAFLNFSCLSSQHLPATFHRYPDSSYYFVFTEISTFSRLSFIERRHSFPWSKILFLDLWKFCSGMITLSEA